MVGARPIGTALLPAVIYTVYDGIFRPFRGG